jgi:hypothetical protein
VSPVSSIRYVSAANAVIISEAFTSSMLELKVYAHRTLFADDYVGDLKETIGILAGADGGGTPTFFINRILVDSSMPVVERVLVVKDTKRPFHASIEFTVNFPTVIQPGQRIEGTIEAAKVAKESNLLPPGFGHGDDTTAQPGPSSNLDDVATHTDLPPSALHVSRTSLHEYSSRIADVMLLLA